MRSVLFSIPPRTRRRRLRSIAALVAVVGLGLGSASCAKARAAAVPDGPPLEIPEPPPRVLGPLVDDVPATTAGAGVAGTGTPAAAAPATPTSRPPTRRTNGGEAETREAPPAPAAAAAPAPASDAAAASRELRAAPAANAAADERKVRDLLTRAARDLSRVDYGRLSVDGRSQYEQSKRFSAQAEQALKDRNVVFADTLADKAATLAAELAGSR